MAVQTEGAPTPSFTAWMAALVQLMETDVVSTHGERERERERENRETRVNKRERERERVRKSASGSCSGSANGRERSSHPLSLL